MTLEHGPNQTVLIGEVRDQAYFYGLLDQLRDLGIELVAVEPPGAADAGAGRGLGARGRHMKQELTIRADSPGTAGRPPLGDLVASLFRM
jgi:hypothetical protein